MKEYKFTFNKLKIDYAAIAKNYASIKNFIGNKVDCAAAIKADAHGLGTVLMMRTLSQAGCNKFFVTTIDEALELRNFSITDEIYVLNGISAGEEAEFAQAQIIPVLNTKEQFELFNSYCRRKDKNFEAVLNIDTGLNYLGIPFDEAIELAEQGFFNQKVKLRFIMSDLACSTNADNPYNKKQLELTKKLQKTFKLPISLATSNAIGLGPEYHFDIIRSSIMLYGAEMAPTPFPLYPAISLSSKIIQIKQAQEDLFVGYDNIGKVSKGSILATIPIGYADGILRGLNNKGIFYINGEPVPIVGNIAMDLITLDVTKVNKYFIHIGTEVEILGKNSTIKSLADSASTNCHEILTSISNGLRANLIC